MATSAALAALGRKRRQFAGEQLSQLIAEEPAHPGELSGNERQERSPEPRHCADMTHRVEHRDPLVDERADAGVQRIGGTGGDLGQWEDALCLAGDCGLAEVVDVVEVAEQRARRQAGPLGDLGRTRLEVALAVQREQGVDDRVAVAVPPDAAPVDGVGTVAVRTSAP